MRSNELEQAVLLLRTASDRADEGQARAAEVGVARQTSARISPFIGEEGCSRPAAGANSE